MKKKKSQDKYYVFVSYTKEDSWDQPDWCYVGEFDTKEDAEESMKETELESYCRHIVIKGEELNVSDGMPTVEFSIEEKNEKGS